MHRCDDMYKCPSTLTSTNTYKCFSKARMLINVFQKQKQNVKTRLLGLIDKVGVDYVDDLFRWLKLGSTNHLLSGVVDEVGDDKGRGNKEEGGPGQIFS